ncbi:MAG TPA: OmpA family protein [Gemmatimonadaceae bacterium]|nr:OmpA family protein [Gemmatimonadaceae bacterium]
MNLKRIALIAAVVPFTAACATKGYVRERVAEVRTYTDSSLAQERAARMAGDSSIAADVASLRTELNNLRTEFGAKITALEEGVKFAFPVNFAFDDATVRDQDRAALDRFAQVVQKHYGGSVITVEGFADPAGSTRYNVGLSQRRAEAVREYLVTQGLTGETLRAVGYGETRQVVNGAERDDPGAEMNRRVVFVVESRGNAEAAGTVSSLQD